MSNLRLSQLRPILDDTIITPSQDKMGSNIINNMTIYRILKEKGEGYMLGYNKYDYYTAENMDKFLRVIEYRKQPGDPVFYKESNEHVPGAYKHGIAFRRDVFKAQEIFEDMATRVNSIIPNPVDHMDLFLIENRIHGSIDYTVRNNTGQTLLIVASMKGFHRTVGEMLCNDSMHINAQDDYGDTALIYACKNNNPQIVQLLLNAGADSRIKNKDGKTCLDSIPGTPEEGRAVRTIVTSHQQRAGYKKRRRTNGRKNHRKNTRKMQH